MADVSFITSFDKTDAAREIITNALVIVYGMESDVLRNAIAKANGVDKKIDAQPYYFED